MKARLVSLCCAALLFACTRSSEPRCETCAMRIDNKSSFFAELEEAGSTTPYDSPRCAFAGLGKHPHATLWVREYYTQERRRAAALRFVEHSDVIGPMGPDLIPVDPAQVTQFVAGHGGGRVSSFEDAKARIRP